jgi:hypothetical protein
MSSQRRALLLLLKLHAVSPRQHYMVLVYRTPEALRAAVAVATEVTAVVVAGACTDVCLRHRRNTTASHQATVRLSNTCFSCGS